MIPASSSPLTNGLDQRPEFPPNFDVPLDGDLEEKQDSPFDRRSVIYHILSLLPGRFAERNRPLTAIVQLYTEAKSKEKIFVFGSRQRPASPLERCAFRVVLRDAGWRKDLSRITAVAIHSTGTALNILVELSELEGTQVSAAAQEELVRWAFAILRRKNSGLSIQKLAAIGGVELESKSSEGTRSL